MAQTFEELISADLDGLYSAAFCFTQDEHRAEELLQECAVRAFHEFRREPPSNFRIWMVERLVASYLARERRRGADPYSENLESIGGAALGDAEFATVAFPEPGTRAYEWLRAWLDQAWPDLDRGDRVVLWLAAVERLRPSRVARMLDIDEDQVRKRHYRARLALSAAAARRLSEGRFGSGEA